ncbi:MAG: extracellular solute-binding protein [Thermomicrobiales bacterium]
MTKLNRRTLVAGAAAAGVAASTIGSMPNASARQDGPVEISFYHIWGTPPGGEAAATMHPADQVIEAFNAQSTTTRVTSQTPGNYYETLQKAQADLAAGNPPALVITPWSNINYANEGLGIVPIQDVAGDEYDTVMAAITPDVLSLVDVEGQTLGVPYAFSCPVFYYNADVLEAAGVDPAVMFKDWASFTTEAPKVQAALGGNPVIALSYNKDWPAQSIIQSNGGRIVDDEGVFSVDSPEAMEAMQTIADLDVAGLYDRGTTAELRPSFVAGSTAVLVSSIASLGGLSAEVQFKLGTAPFPQFGEKPRSASSGGSFIGVYAQDDDQKAAAWEFIKFALSEAGYTIWMKTGYLNITSYEIPVLPGQEAAYTQLEEGLTSETRWPGARASEAQATWGTFVERIWANDVTVEEGLGMAIDEVNSIIA